ncbi:hypothetical protein KAR91_65070 [Candidatus Pacearchaeota archaeon]|nr:hypothetical protein [Candidatus Pacearchaeota archaeon]
MKKKRYYREWLAQCGWGVMIGYDTVMAKSDWDATKNKPFDMYSYDKSFEFIGRVKKEHLNLTDLELSKIYGEKEK